jgi:hypothetical protein
MSDGVSPHSRGEPTAGSPGRGEPTKGQTQGGTQTEIQIMDLLDESGKKLDQSEFNHFTDKIEDPDLQAELREMGQNETAPFKEKDIKKIIKDYFDNKDGQQQ